MLSSSVIVGYNKTWKPVEKVKMLREKTFNKIYDISEALKTTKLALPQSKSECTW